MKKTVILVCAVVLLMLFGCESADNGIPEQILFSKARISVPESVVPVMPEENDTEEEEEPESRYYSPEKVVRTAEPESAGSGKIIVLSHTGDDGSYTFVLSSIDAETAETVTYRQFYCTEGNDFTYVYPGHERRLFSEDFRRMAIDRLSARNGRCSIGWMESVGNWINVTAALGLGDGYRSVGFYGDRFIFEKYSGTDKGIFSVPIGDLSQESVTKGNPENPAFTYEELESPWLENTVVTDWFSDGKCIVNEVSADGIPTNTVIADRTVQKLRNYIPAGNRLSVHGVISPDEDMVAFVSISYDEEKPTGIFITKLDADVNPIMLHTHITFAEHCNFDLPDVPVTLDWIK